MGVHDVAVYSEVKELFGIPNDEPIFVLRAQDLLYTPTLGTYEQLYMATIWTVARATMKGDPTGPHIPAAERNFVDHISACRDNGRRWQIKNSGKVKVPDF